MILVCRVLPITTHPPKIFPKSFFILVVWPKLVFINDGNPFMTIEFGEIPNFSRQAEQAGKLTYMILYFHIKIQQCDFFDITLKCLDFCTKIQFAVYLISPA